MVSREKVCICRSARAYKCEFLSHSMEIISFVAAVGENYYLLNNLQALRHKIKRRRLITR